MRACSSSGRAPVGHGNEFEYPEADGGRQEMRLGTARVPGQ